MALTTTFHNVKISENNIDQGIYSTGTYKYDQCINVNGDALISKNNIANPVNLADMIQVSAGSCVIQENKLIRNAVYVDSYIKVLSANDQVITNNFFDNTTTDNSNDLLVSGLSSASVYENNKNQVQFLTIPIIEHYVGDGTFSSGYDGTTNVLASGTSTVIKTITFSISEHLPKSSKILSMQIGIAFSDIATASVNTLGSNYFTLTLKSYPIVRANYSSGAGSILDVHSPVSSVGNNSGNYSFNSAPTFAAMKAATQYILIDLSSDDNYYLYNDTSIVLGVDLAYHLTSGSGYFNISQLIVKYTT